MVSRFFIVTGVALLLVGCSASSVSNLSHQLGAGTGAMQGRVGHEQPNGSPAPLPSPHLLTSIDTGDILNIPPAQAAPYVTIGHTASSPLQADQYSSVGIDAVPYTDINHYLPGDTSGTNPFLSMGNVALTCSGQPVQWVKPGHPTIYLTDPRNPTTVLAWEAWYTNFVNNGGSTWAIYEDTADSPYTYAQPAPPCAADGSGPVSQAEWTAAAEAQEGAMQAFSGKAILFNGLAAGYNKLMPATNALLDGPVAGGEAEACAPSNTTEWMNELIIQIHAVQRQKYFICHGNLTTDGSTPQAIAFRNYHFASMMLDYDINHTIYESYWAVGLSNLRVEPESEVVMLNPLKAVINTPADLLKPGGAYGRRYGKCYVAGVYVGACAAVVNPNSTPVAYPYPPTRYTHTMLLTGSGVYDGATVSAAGPAPGATLAPYSGEVVFL